MIPGEVTGSTNRTSAKSVSSVTRTRSSRSHASRISVSSAPASPSSCTSCTSQPCSVRTTRAARGRFSSSLNHTSMLESVRCDRALTLRRTRVLHEYACALNSDTPPECSLRSRRLRGCPNHVHGDSRSAHTRLSALASRVYDNMLAPVHGNLLKLILDPGGYDARQATMRSYSACDPIQNHSTPSGASTASAR